MTSLMQHGSYIILVFELWHYQRTNTRAYCTSYREGGPLLTAPGAEGGFVTALNASSRRFSVCVCVHAFSHARLSDTVLRALVKKKKEKTRPVFHPHHLTLTRTETQRADAVIPAILPSDPSRMEDLPLIP